VLTLKSFSPIPLYSGHGAQPPLDLEDCHVARFPHFAWWIRKQTALSIYSMHAGIEETGVVASYFV